MSVCHFTARTLILTATHRYQTRSGTPSPTPAHPRPTPMASLWPCTPLPLCASWGVGLSSWHPCLFNGTETGSGLGREDGWQHLPPSNRRTRMPTKSRYTTLCTISELGMTRDCWMTATRVTNLLIVLYIPCILCALHNVIHYFYFRPLVRSCSAQRSRRKRLVGDISPTVTAVATSVVCPPADTEKFPMQGGASESSGSVKVSAPGRRPEAL